MPSRALPLAALACLVLIGAEAGPASPTRRAEHLGLDGAGAWSADERRVLFASGIVDEDLIAALDGQETVRAIIVFAMPGQPAFSPGRGWCGSRGRRRGAGGLWLARDPGSVRSGRVRADLGSFRRSGPSRIEISRAGLLRVLDDPNVRRVGLDPPVVPPARRGGAILQPRRAPRPRLHRRGSHRRRGRLGHRHRPPGPPRRPRR